MIRTTLLASVLALVVGTTAWVTHEATRVTPTSSECCACCGADCASCPGCAENCAACCGGK